ncbi:hypothetical protein L915_09263, partial [Phytophthora nicotianae]
MTQLKAAFDYGSIEMRPVPISTVSPTPYLISRAFLPRLHLEGSLATSRAIFS